MMNVKKCDGFVALVPYDSKTAVMTTRIPGSQVKVTALSEMRAAVESSPFKKMVLEFDIVVEAGMAYIYAVIESATHTKKWIKKRLQEFVDHLRMAGIIRKPIISHVKVPVKSYKLA